ncbi:MAG: phytanoyl-CoA dioxygenase family protein [Bacteriovoracaceae bacterium]|nr:phytanoyl-CoA dioxygenase family protein [Bacteriovoracaceae bacterium]
MSNSIPFIRLEDIKSSYEKHGFFAIKDFIPQSLIREAEVFIKKLFATVSHKGETIDETVIRLNKENSHQLYLIYQTISRSIEIDQLRVQLKKAMDTIYPNLLHIELGAGLLFGIPGDERISYDWHQEIHYHQELENVIHFWLPVIHDATMDNGTMSVLDGSNNRGKLPFKKKEKAVPNSVTNLVIQNIDHLKIENQELFAIAKPGDLVGLHSYIVHRSNKNPSSNKVRFIISCRIAAINHCPSTFDFSVKE